MARRGRKGNLQARRRRTLRAERTPPDKGTAELRRQRAALVGVANQSDPQAGDPLGVLLLNGFLTETQVQAAWRYATLRWSLFGKPFPPAAHVYDPFAPRTGEPPDDAKLEDRYAFCCDVLRDCGRLAAQEARSLAVEQRLPAWFHRLKSGRMRPGDRRRQEALLLGLTTLADALGLVGNSTDEKSSCNATQKEVA